jgi:hypothetical protein
VIEEMPVDKVRKLEAGRHMLVFCEGSIPGNSWSLWRMHAGGLSNVVVGWGGDVATDEGVATHEPPTPELPPDHQYYPVPPELADAIIMAAIHMLNEKWQALAKRIVST